MIKWNFTNGKKGEDYFVPICLSPVVVFRVVERLGELCVPGGSVLTSGSSDRGGQLVMVGLGGEKCGDVVTRLSFPGLFLG